VASVLGTSVTCVELDVMAVSRRTKRSSPDPARAMGTDPGKERGRRRLREDAEALDRWPPIRCFSMISGTSSAFTPPYQTPSG